LNGDENAAEEKIGGKRYGEVRKFKKVRKFASSNLKFRSSKFKFTEILICNPGKSLSASESAGYRNLSRPRTDTAADKPREQKEGEVQSVHGVLTELAEAEGMTYDEFVTNGLGKLITIRIP
jgi:hypothetical protein